MRHDLELKTPRSGAGASRICAYLRARLGRFRRYPAPPLDSLQV